MTRFRALRLLEFKAAGRIRRCRHLHQLVQKNVHDAHHLVDEVAQQALPRNTSPYAGDNRVFASGWEERLVRTQVSRFYNQAVLETLVSDGATDCFVDHSSSEQSTSECSVNLAGKRHSPQALLDRLVRSYRDGAWTKDFKIPHHPHCTHTVQP